MSQTPRTLTLISGDAQSPRVLIIEDNNSDAIIAQAAIEKTLGRFSEVLRAHTLSIGLDHLKSADVDFVVLDLNLPDSRGIETLRRVRVATTRPIIVVTASDQPILDAEALENGAFEILHKDKFVPDAIGRMLRLAAEQRRTQKSFESAELRFRRLTELSSDWYWEQNAELRFVSTGGPTNARGGITPADHIGKQRWELPGTEIINQTWKEHRAVLAERRPFRDVLLRRTDGDGLVSFVEVTGEPIFDAQGTFSGYHGIARDVTNRVSNEEALERTSSRLELALKASRACTWDYDVSADEIVLSESWAEMLGAQPRVTRTTSKALARLVHPDDIASFRVKFFAALKGPGAEYSVENRVRHETGEWRWILSRGKVVRRDDQGRAVRMVGTNLDITEGKRTEEELRNSRRMLEIVIDAIPMSIFAKDRNSNYIMVNKYAAEFFESSKQAMVRLHTSRLPTQEATRTQSLMDDEWVYKNRRTFVHETVIQRPDGTPVPFHSSKIPLFDDDGNLMGLLGINRDITERKLQQEKIDRLNRVRIVLSGINSAIVRMRERNELFGEVCRIAVSEGKFMLARVIELEANGLAQISATSESTASPLFQEVLDEYNSNPGRSQSLIAHALRTGQPLISNDVANDPRIPERVALTKKGNYALALLPLIVEKRVAGAVVLRAYETGMFDDDERRLLLELVGNLSFALELMDKQKRLDRLAYYDALTDLPNRALLHDRIGHAMARADRGQTLLAVMFLDLDHFKEINDRLGHAVGDEVLREVARRVQCCLRSTDTVGRLGGDEFTVLLEDIHHIEEISTVALKILDAFTKPLEVGGRELHLSTSIGITLYPDDNKDAGTLLKNADIAMYQAKREGRNNFQFFAREMSARIARQADLRDRLRHALERKEFALHYQPQVRVTNGQITGVEALLRWTDAELGSVSPELFIPVAEEMGLIIPLGDWVLREACRQCKTWLDAGLGPLRVAVNLSPHQFRQRMLAERVGEILGETGLPGSCLEIEITEGVVMRNAETAVKILTELNQLGVQIAIDDFGTGYSSLAYLQRFPVHVLKVDQSFVQAIRSRTDHAPIVNTVIQLAKLMGLKALAEGVETAEQHDYLRARGCDAFQGYLFSEPQPAEQMGELLIAHRREIAS